MLLSLLFCLFQPSAFEEKAIEKVDDLLESYMGIRDTELGEWMAPLLGRGGSLGPERLCYLCIHSAPPPSGHHGGTWKRQEEPG